MQGGQDVQGTRWLTDRVLVGCYVLPLVALRIVVLLAQACTDCVAPLNTVWAAALRSAAQAHTSWKGTMRQYSQHWLGPVAPRSDVNPSGHPWHDPELDQKPL
jgi:hypothetical protein